jgi:hypothetical protein
VLTEEDTVAVSVMGFIARTGLGDAVTPVAGEILLTVISCMTSVAAK